LVWPPFSLTVLWNANSFLHFPIREFEKINPPGWIIGHLCLATDYVLRLCGQSMACPREWHAMFGRGSNPSRRCQDYPTIEVLRTAYEAGHRRAIDAALALNDQWLARPHQVPFFEPSPLKTVADVLTGLMSAHEGFHLGQLSTWRRAAGRASVGIVE
jgi:hypothetical protein